MSDTKLKREDEIDQRAQEVFASHPDLQENDLGKREKQLGDSYAQAGIDQAEAFSNDPANSLREREDNPFNYEGQESSSPTPKRWTKFKVIGKKYGPAGGIIGLIFGGIFGFGVLLSPSLAIVHMKEVFTEDLNDQVSAMDMRTTHVFRAKLKGLGKSGSICRGMANVRCGLRGMSDRQIKNFEKAGIEVEKGEKNSITRKSSIKKLTFTSSTGKKVEITSVKDINKMMVDKNIRSQIRRAYNPKFYGMWDKTAGKAFTRFGQTKASHITGDTDEERNKSVNEAVSGNETGTSTDGKRPTDTEDEAQNEENRKYNEQVDKMNEAIHSSSGFKGLFKGAIKGVGVLGWLDSACSVYNASRMVEAGAKIIRARQLVAFAMIYMNLADKIKAGDATPEEVSYAGSKLTAIDTEAKIIDETSKDFNTKVDNPYYGKSALDSEGAKAAFYNEAPTLTARAQQYMAGGALVGRLSKVNDTVLKILQTDRRGARSKCKIVQNGFVRFGSLIVGGALAAGSFGWSTAISLTSSLAISMALPILLAYLKDMVAGTVVDSSTEGVDAGNAIFSGTGILLGNMAMERGMQPANKSQIAKYQLATAETKNDIIATETEDAKSKPFDIMNQYSFTGSLLRNLMPAYTTGTSSVATLPLKIPSLLANVIPAAKAVGDYNGDRFTKCNDAGYEELGINADIFCNVRYIMTPEELAMDTDEVYKYMAEDNDYVDDDSGEPKGLYADFVKECVDREAVWGEGSEGESDDYGNHCIDGTSTGKFSAPQLHNFRVYTMDRSITDGMDNGPETGSGGTSLTNIGSEFRVASFNVLGAAHTEGPKKNKSGFSNSSIRIKTSAGVITSNHFQIVGFQEMEKGQAKMMEQLLPNFGHTTVGKDQDRIMWDKAKFDKVDEGTWKSTYFGGVIDEPWVKLKDIGTGQALYVMNVHDPINRGAGDKETRYQNALKHLAQVKKLSEDAPVIFTGDFNEGYTKDAGAGAPSNAKTTYCVLVGDGTMNDAYDLTVPRDSGCPNNTKDRSAPNTAQIDHIYLSAGVEASTFKGIKGGNDSNGSDHNTVYSDVVITSSSSDGDASGTGKDIQGDDYAKECGKYLSPGDCTGECVGFVKFRLVKHGVISLPVSFVTGGHTTAVLKGLGFKVNTTPAVHAVMSLRHNSTGHTAMVSAVWSDGSITVEEYNWPGGHHYNQRRISKAQLESYISKGELDFAHTEGKYK